MLESKQHTASEEYAATGATSGSLAAAREKRIPEDGDQTISLWTAVICGAVLILSGFILSYGGTRFSYAALFRDGYVRGAVPGSSATPLPPKPALEAYMARGKKVFEGKCITCHGPEAKGNGTTYPSLVGSAWANGETERFSMIILNGLQGPTSNGKIYGIMTMQGLGMTPEELAGIMTYIRNHFGNTKGDVISVEMAKAAMTISAARPTTGQAVTAKELTADHLKPLAGQAITATTMVNPLTLEAVSGTAGNPATPTPAAPAAPAAPAPAPAPATSAPSVPKDP
ncbi:MAG: cytochrome c [Verrucomicrobiota bacterium]